MVLIVVILAFLGLCAGSFVNALVWRTRQNESSKSAKKLSVLNGRSQCPNCGHQLAAKDLVPVLSWLSLNQKCRYCGSPISIQYPLVEALTAIVFVCSYLLWPVEPNVNGQWLLLATWLASSVGLMALAVYELKWMILPNRIIYPTLAAAATGRGAYIIFYQNQPVNALWLWALSVAVASGFFWLLFYVSKGKWIGFGDIRLGLITGTLLAHPAKSLAMIFIASLLGTIMVLPAILSGQKRLANRIPYGPYLIVGAGIMVIWGDSLIRWYKHLLNV
jgi:leader peptidase (prepilin peptidase)/N-methyltransferase